MNDQLFDCGIAGGGLAGLTLAIQLAGAGYSVVLFEKEKYPFHKVCGEYISMESVDFLERLGLPLSAMDLPVINEVKISSPNGNSFTRKLDLGGFGISRFTLDSALAAIAKTKGVALLQGTKVTGIVFENDSFLMKTDQQTYRVKTAFGAYGKRSALDKKLNRNFLNPIHRKEKNYVAVKYHVKTDFPPNRIELHNFKDGYCGISKVDGDRYCLCYLTDSKNLKNNNNDIKLMEQNVLMKNPFLKKYFTDAVILYEQPLTISQITFGKKSTIENHVLMLGDAAGTITPLCGNGMSMAMHASFKAFGLTDKFLKGKITRQVLESSYSNEWNNLFLNRIKTGLFLQHLFGKNLLTNIAIGLLKRTPFVTDKLIKKTHGSKF
ncbi:MAG TPA: pyridine nucleotide-disulfide oxidoreductase [Mucilaginibacter sp.]|jgi:flavin-dependent dehydrogenase|nr:pyridine nucleotide-disulfide oxidoreductase [Mucilaginibacter sp.]